MSQVKQIERLMKDVDDERVLRYAAEDKVKLLRSAILIIRRNTVLHGEAYIVADEALKATK